MKHVDFEWDPAKSRANMRKHGVSFDEAQTVFFDEHALVAHDPEHSDNEDRFILVGFSALARVLLVCFCERLGGGRIRIVSARKLTRQERNHFSKGVVP